MYVLLHINAILLKWVSIWHPLPFFLCLRLCFRSESEDVEGNRVKVKVTVFLSKDLFWIKTLVKLNHNFDNCTIFSLQCMYVFLFFQILSASFHCSKATKRLTIKMSKTFSCWKIYNIQVVMLNNDHIFFSSGEIVKLEVTKQSNINWFCFDKPSMMIKK